MARQAKSNYIEAGIQVLTELGGTLSSKDIVKAAQERGLIGTTTYVYHNFLRKLRESDLFDTSVRGQVSLIAETESLVEARPGSKTPDAAPILVGAPAAIISEILSPELPGTENALGDVEDEEIDPDGVQMDKGF